MRYIQLILRIVLAVGVLYLGGAIAESLDGIEVTAPGLALLMTIIVALGILGKAIVRLIAPSRDIVATSTLASRHMEEAQPIVSQIRRNLEKRARHEAAHAVVAYALGHKVISATIRVQGFSGGQVAWQHEDKTTASVDHIAVCFAGPLAEQTGDVIVPSAGGTDDYSQLLGTAIAASITDPENRTPGEILDAGTRLARELVAQHPCAIQALAERLIETKENSDLDEVEIREVMRRHHVRPSPQSDQRE